MEGQEGQVCCEEGGKAAGDSTASDSSEKALVLG